MAALVGTIGTAVQSTSGSAASPAFGASENRTNGNLIVLWVTVTGTATLPTTPVGYAIAKQVAGTSTSATIYYKNATGSDAAPTISGIASGLIAAQLGEFSGALTLVDQSGSSTGTTSPNTATGGGANAATGELIVMAAADFRSVARASNDTWTSNDGTPTLGGSNNGTSSTNHYSHAYIASSTGTTAETSVVTLSITTSITGIANVNASFKTGKGTFQQWAQAQADILDTSNGFAQAQAQVDTGIYSASDAFNRSVSAGSWGTADVGGAWTIPANGSMFSVDGSEGVISLTGISLLQLYALLKGVSTQRITQLKTNFVINAAAGISRNASIYFHNNTNGAGDQEFGTNLDFNQSTLAYTIRAYSGGTQTITGTLVTGTVYTLVCQVLLPQNAVDNKLNIRIKFYTGTESAGWQIDETLTVGGPIYRLFPGLEYAADRASTIYFDNFSFGPIGWTQYGQAQAAIEVTSNGFAQAQAKINAFGVKGFAQAQATIGTPTSQFAQAIADILATSNKFAQANTRITAFVTSGTVSGTTTQTITLNGLQENDLVVAWLYSPNTLSVNFSPIPTNLESAGVGGTVGTTNTALVTYSIRGLKSGSTSSVITITVASGTGTFLAHAAAFRAGQGLVYLADNPSRTNAVTGTNPSIGSPTIAAGQIPQDLVVGAVGELTATNATAGANFLGIAATNDGSTESLTSEYYDFATSSIAVNFTNANSVEWAGIASSFIKARVTFVSAQAQAQIILKQRGVSQAAALVNGTYFLPFLDTFTRTVTDSLGTADNGDTWTLLTGTAANADVGGSSATLVSDASTSQIWYLPQTLLAAGSGSGYEISAIISVDKLPSTGSISLDFGILSPGSSPTTSNISSISNLGSGGSLSLLSQAFGSQISGGPSIPTYTPGDSYNFKTHIIPSPGGVGNVLRFRRKLWKVGDTEPGWTEIAGSITISGNYGLNKPFIAAISTSDANGPFTWTIDNFKILAASWTFYGQAQAQIQKIGQGFSQAQTRIGQTTYERILRGISGLQSYWTLGEPSGSTAISDYVGAVSGTVNGTPTFSQAPDNNQQLEPGIKFNSSSDYLTFGDNYDLVGTSFDFSAIVWFKHNGALSVSGERLLDKESSNNVGWAFYVSSAGVSIGFGGSGVTNSNVISAGNTWQMAATSTAGGGGRVAVDQYNFGPAAGRSGADNSNLLTVGRNAYNSTGAFNGTIGSIAIFNTAISFDDIQALYTIEKSGAIVRPAQAQASILKAKGLGQAAALVNGTYFLPFLDTFTRSVSNGLGTSDNGDTWTLITGSASNFNVGGTSATLATQSSGQRIDLKRTLLSARGYEISGQISINKLTATDITFIILGFPDLVNVNQQQNISVSIIVNTSTLSFRSVVSGVVSTLHQFIYTPNDIYNFKVQFNLVSGSRVRVRFSTWKVGDSEPGLADTTDQVYTSFGLSRPTIIVPGESDANTPFTWTLDNYQIIEAGLTQSAQAQAQIISVTPQFAQAQVKISTTRVYAQAQGTIVLMQSANPIADESNTGWVGVVT